MNLPMSRATAAEKVAKATWSIAYLWGTRNRCQDAVACLVVAAGQMGIEIEPRAVSILVNNRDTGRVATTGQAAFDALPEALARSAVYSPSSEFERAGHMIATSDELSLYFDPTFQQFSPSGSPAVPLMGAMNRPQPRNSRLRVDHGEHVEVAYFFDDANTGWQHDFERAKPQWENPARAIVANIEAGGAPKDLGFVIPWDEFER